MSADQQVPATAPVETVEFVAPAAAPDLSVEELESKYGAEVEASEPEAAAPPAGSAPAVEPDRLDKASGAARSAREAARRHREGQARHSAQERELAALRQAQAEHAKLQKLLTDDPVGALKSLGVQDKDIADRVMAAGGPESQLEEYKKIALEAKREVDALKRSLSAREEGARREEVMGAYIELTSDEAQYPNLAVAPVPVVDFATREVVRGLMAKGEDPSVYTDGEIAEAAEAWLVKNSRKKAAAGTAPPAAKVNGRVPPPKTITNDLGSRRYGKPANWDSLSLEDQEKFIEQAYK